MYEKESLFVRYCQHCKNHDKMETENPCRYCLKYPTNGDSHKPTFYDGRDLTKAELGQHYDALQRLKFALYEAKYSKLEYSSAYEDSALAVKFWLPGGCTSFRIGNNFTRSYDWYYDDHAEFATRVKGNKYRYRYYGTSGGFPNLTDDFVKSGKPSDDYALVPFQLIDGMNEKRLAISMNVVPAVNSEFIENLNSDKVQINYLRVCSWVLSNFANAKDAVDYIRDNVKIVFSEELIKLGYEVHWIIADRDDTYIVEVVDGQNIIIKCNDSVPSLITNFHIYGVKFNDDGTVYTPESSDNDHNAIITNKIHPYGSGLERYNLVLNKMKESNYDIWSILDELNYTKTYSTSSSPADPFWYTEYVSPGKYTVATSVEDFAPVVEKYGNIYLSRNRGDKLTWQSVHQINYDLESGIITLRSQEEPTRFSFHV